MPNLKPSGSRLILKVTWLSPSRNATSCHATVRACMIHPDPAWGTVLLRDLPDAMYLGCRLTRVTDARMDQLWVQNVDGRSGLPAMRKHSPTIAWINAGRIR
jgi:hypothetical protein